MYREYLRLYDDNNQVFRRCAGPSPPAGLDVRAQRVVQLEQAEVRGGSGLPEGQTLDRVLQFVLPQLGGLQSGPHLLQRPHVPTQR